MFIQWMSNPVYTACDRLVKLTYLNFLWVIFTLAGGVVAGIFPATAALFHMLRRLVRGETLNDVLQHYALFYKQEFIRSNKYGLFFWAGAVLLTVNLLLLTQFSGLLLIGIMSGMIFTIFLFLTTLAFFFPVYAAMPDLGFKNTVKLAFFLPFSRTSVFLLAFGGSALLAAAFFVFPVLLTFWGASAFAFLYMKAVEMKLSPKRSIQQTGAYGIS